MEEPPPRSLHTLLPNLGAWFAAQERAGGSGAGPQAHPLVCAGGRDAWQRRAAGAGEGPNDGVSFPPS